MLASIKVELGGVWDWYLLFSPFILIYIAGEKGIAIILARTPISQVIWCGWEHVQVLSKFGASSEQVLSKF